MGQSQAEAYLLDDADFERERRRLDLLSRLYNPLAQDKLRALDLTTGDTCLEAGFGNGSMLAWLAEQVGADGHVVGLDREPRYASHLKVRTIEIVRGDVSTTDLSETQADLVYARLLLEHVGDPLRALKNLTSALKPGGRILIVATDFTPFGAADPSHARAREFEATWISLKHRFEKSELMDLAFGPKVPDLFRQAGLFDIEHDVTLFDATPGSDFTREYVMAASSLAELSAEFAGPCRTMINIVSDPSFSFHYQNIHCITGRRPN